MQAAVFDEEFRDAVRIRLGIAIGSQSSEVAHVFRPHLVRSIAPQPPRGIDVSVNVRGVHDERLSLGGRHRVGRVDTPFVKAGTVATVRHVFAPESDTAEAGIVAARTRVASRTVEFVCDAEFAAHAPLGRGPTRIQERVRYRGVDARVVVEGLLVPSLTIVVAVEHHAIAPSAVDDERKAVVFGGLHPIVIIGTPVGAKLFEVRKDHFGLVPGLAVGRTPIFGGDGAVVEVAGEDMDDATVGTRGHHGRMRVRTVVGVKGSRGAVGHDVVLVLNEVDTKVAAGVGGHNNTVVLVAGDGTETGFLAFDATTASNPLVVHSIVGADGGTTVTVAAVGGAGEAKVDLTIGPNNRPGAGTVVRLPVVGGVVQLATSAGHVGLALHVGERAAFDSFSLLHGGDGMFVLVGHGFHLRVAAESYRQGQC